MGWDAPIGSPGEPRLPPMGRRSGRLTPLKGQRADGTARPRTTGCAARGGWPRVDPALGVATAGSWRRCSFAQEWGPRTPERVRRSVPVLSFGREGSDAARQARGVPEGRPAPRQAAPAPLWDRLILQPKVRLLPAASAHTRATATLTSTAVRTPGQARNRLFCLFSR